MTTGSETAKLGGSALRKILILAVVILTLGIHSACCFHVITKVEMTRTAMIETLFRINLYAERNYLASLNEILPRNSAGASENISNITNRAIKHLAIEMKKS